MSGSLVFEKFIPVEGLGLAAHHAREMAPGTSLVNSGLELGLKLEPNQVYGSLKRMEQAATPSTMKADRDAAAEIGRNPASTRFSLNMEMSRLTRDRFAKPVSRDKILRREWGQGYIIIAVHSRYSWISFMLTNRGLG